MLLRFWTWTDDADAEPPVQADDGVDDRYYWARRVRYWKAYKPKAGPF
jgi:hypothetical protein